MMPVLNRLASLLLGLVLLAGGLLVAVNGVLALTGRHPWPVRVDRWYPTLTGTALGSHAVLVAGAGLAALGVVLLVTQVRPWAPARLSVVAVGPPRVWWVHRRSVEHRVADAANAVAGVDRARARLRGRAVRWRLRVSAVARPDARDAVEDAVRDELARLSAPEPARLRIALRRPKRVA